LDADFKQRARTSGAGRNELASEWSSEVVVQGRAEQATLISGSKVTDWSKMMEPCVRSPPLARRGIEVEWKEKEKEKGEGEGEQREGEGKSGRARGKGKEANMRDNLNILNRNVLCLFEVQPHIAD